MHIHNTELVPVSTGSAILPDHFIIDLFDQTTSSIRFLSTPGFYRAILFLIGVDSSRNFSGAQTGALEPGKSIIWTWNSGYTIAKQEGNSKKYTADVSIHA